MRELISDGDHLRTAIGDQSRRPEERIVPRRRRGRCIALELTFCSLFTLLPDYLYRRYVQGKRIGHEITIYSVWYVLRYGITGCLMLTVALITLNFCYHPSTTNVVGRFRAVPIVPEIDGRVAEVYVNAYTNNHELLANKNIGFFERLFCTSLTLSASFTP
jgi:hypothetical protein